MKLSAAAQSNKDISLAHERVVVVGGTAGIGEGVANRFAEAGAEVWLVGRNEEKAKIILERLRTISAKKNLDQTPEHAFLQADLTLIAESKRIAAEIRTRAGEKGIEYLVMTQGGPANGTFVPTSEGYEQHYAVVLSRLVIAHELAANPESSTVKRAVMSIMAPGVSVKKVDPGDFALQKAKDQGKYGILLAASRDSLVVDATTEDLSKSNPNVNFTHIFPGTVNTNVMSNAGMPWYLRYLVAVMMVLFGAAPKDYAEIPFYLLANPEGRVLASKEKFFNEKAEKQKPSTGLQDENLRDRIRNYLKEIFA